MGPETLVTSHIKKYFEKEGWIVVKNLGNVFCNRGYPDLTLLKNGQAVFIEVKAGSKYGATAGQLDWIERLKAQGFRAGVAHNVQEVKEIVHE